VFAARYLKFVRTFLTVEDFFSNPSRHRRVFLFLLPFGLVKTTQRQNKVEQLVTTAPVVECAPFGWRPEFIRLPRLGTLCCWTGLSRSTLNHLILPSADNNFRAPVRSVSLRTRGSTKGVRLIDFASLITYLNSFGDDEKPQSEGRHSNFPTREKPAARLVEIGSRPVGENLAPIVEQRLSKKGGA